VEDVYACMCVYVYVLRAERTVIAAWKMCMHVCLSVFYEFVYHTNVACSMRCTSSMCCMLSTRSSLHGTCVAVMGIIK
jgi:hypothetical protein